MKVFRPTYRDKITKEIKEMKNYYVYHRGKRYPLHVSDKKSAETKARALITSLELGFDPARIDTAKSSKLSLLMDEFIGSLAGRAGPIRQNGLRKALGKIIRELKASTLADLTCERCKVWLRNSPNSKRTKQHHTRHLRQFGSWLVVTERTQKNPFAALDAVTDIEGDRRLSRRALTEVEIATLLAKTPESPTVWYGMTGRDRAWAYRVVLATGFRRQELGSLTPGSFSLASTPPSVRVRASYTKNRKEAVQPLPVALAADLRAYLVGFAADAPVFPVASRKTADMLREDLEFCGIPVEVEGRVMDWHALRTTFGTLLAIKGVPLALGMKLMRHSDPRLTAQVYTVATLADLGKEIEKLG